MIHVEILDAIYSKYGIRIRVQNLYSDYYVTNLELSVDIAQQDRFEKAPDNLPSKIRQVLMSILFRRKWHRVTPNMSIDCMHPRAIYSGETRNLAWFIFNNLNSAIVYPYIEKNDTRFNTISAINADLVPYEILKDVPLNLRVTAKYQPGFYGAKIHKETSEFKLWTASSLSSLPNKNVLAGWAVTRSGYSGQVSMESESGCPVIG